MTNELKNKYYLGELTLGDLAEKIKGLDVVVDHVHYKDWRFSRDKMLFWYSGEDEDVPDFEILLNSPVRLMDGKVVVFDRLMGQDIILSFGRMINPLVLKFMRTEV
jgi:hypothetical protein